MKRLYVPLDATFQTRPGVIAAGPAAELVYLRSLAWAKLHETDGQIRRAHLGFLADGFDDPDLLADRLVDAGLWLEHPDGWTIDDWHAWNPTNAKLDEDRAGNRARQQAYRDRKKNPASSASTDTRNALRVTRDTPVTRDALVTRLREGKGREDKGITSKDPLSDSPANLTVIPLEDFRTTDTELDHDIQTIFTHWIERTGRTGRTRLDTKRRNRILWALDHYPLGDILDAIDGCAESPFHQGHNDHGKPYNDLALILRDAEHVERFRDGANGIPIPPGFGALLALHQAQP